MPTARHHQQPNHTANTMLALVLSLVAHVLLAVGLWHVSQGRDVNNTNHVEVTMVSPEMLAQMRAAAKANAQDAALGNTPSIKNMPQKGSTDGVLPTPQPVKPEPVKPAAPTFQASTTQPEPKYEPAEPLTGKPDTSAQQATDDWVEQQRQALEDMRRKERQERAEKDKQQKQAEAELAAKKEAERKQRQEAQQKERERLAAMKQAERNQPDELKKRRDEIAKAKEENEARLRAQEQKNAEQSKKQSLAESGEALGVENAADDEFGSIGSSIEDSKAKAANEKQTVANYNSLIAAKVKPNWTKNTSIRSIIPVRIKLNGAGRVISAKVTRTSGDKTLDDSLEKAIKQSSPLPVPKDPAIRNKYFANFIFEFETY